MDEKGRATAVSLENEPVIELGGVWRKIFKKGRHEGRHRYYPHVIHCRKCGKRILNHTWFYAKKSGGKNQYRTEYYCESCYEKLWHE
jgi:hypothetical protein